MDLCVYESEEHEHGVGGGVNTTLLSDTLQSVGLSEYVESSKVWFRKKTIMDLCVVESEESEDGVGAGVNVVVMSDVLYYSFLL